MPAVTPARQRRGVKRLTAAGATLIRTDELQGRPDHVVLADPEGNEFCLA